MLDTYIQASRIATSNNVLVTGITIRRCCNVNVNAYLLYNKHTSTMCILMCYIRLWWCTEQFASSLYVWGKVMSKL